MSYIIEFANGLGELTGIDKEYIKLNERIIKWKILKIL